MENLADLFYMIIKSETKPNSLISQKMKDNLNKFVNKLIEIRDTNGAEPDEMGAKRDVMVNELLEIYLDECN